MCTAGKEQCECSHFTMNENLCYIANFIKLLIVYIVWKTSKARNGRSSMVSRICAFFSLSNYSGRRTIRQGKAPAHKQDKSRRLGFTIEMQCICDFFLQTRGSIPLQWTQRPTLKYKPNPMISPIANQVSVHNDVFHNTWVGL